MNALLARITNWISTEDGQWHPAWSGVAFVILIVFILWLTEAAGKTNFFE